MTSLYAVLATSLREQAGCRRLLACPEDAQDDDTPLIVEDEIDDQAIAVVAEGVRAHIRIGTLPVIGIAAPRFHLEHSHQFREERERFGRQRRELTNGVLLLFDRIHRDYKPNRAFT